MESKLNAGRFEKIVKILTNSKKDILKILENLNSNLSKLDNIDEWNHGSTKSNKYFNEIYCILAKTVAKVLNGDKEIENICYFWPGYTSIYSHRFSITPEDSIKYINEEIPTTGIGVTNNGKFFHSSNSFWFEAFLNSVKLPKETKFIPPTTHFWILGQDQILELKDGSEIKFLSIHCVDDVSTSEPEFEKSHIKVSIGRENLIESCSIVSKYLNTLDNYNNPNEQKFVNYPENRSKADYIKKYNDESNSKPTKICDYQQAVYALWYASVFNDEVIDNAFIARITQKLIKLGFIDVTERINNFYRSFVEVNNKINRDKFNHWYTVYIDTFHRQKDLGTFMFLTQQEVEDWLLTMIYQYVKDVYNTIREIENDARHKYNEHKIKKASIKSAVSAIMSRNMSHNLGSHVLSNLKGELEEMGKLFKDNHDKNECMPFKSENLFGLKWFINYLQERQDFIATIGGFENQTFMPVNFKTFVFDGLLPDHQYQRHSTSTNLNAHKNYLLEYIIKSENIERDRIVIKYKKFESSVSHDKNYGINTDYKKLTQISVSFPGGIVGRQAFFSIFENIIRNAAKHSEIKANLEITIDTPDDHDYDTNEYIKFTISDNLKTFKMAELKIRKALDEFIFNESQEKQGNKGIKEMKISAAWLRGIRLEDIDSYKEEKDVNGFIIHPKIIDIATTIDGSIQYVFHLLKPKELVLYLNSSVKNDLGITDEERMSFNENGIDVITPEYFQDGKNYNLRHSLFVIQHENLITQEKNFTNKYIENTFNQRRLVISGSSLRSIFQIHRKEPAKLITAFWKVYLGLDKSPMPFIDFRPSKVEDTPHFEKFREIEIGEKNKYEFPDLKLLFNHHNDTEKNFDDFRKKEYPDLFNNLLFLEGISGGNSTEMLTSRTEKSELFYYKLLQSCVTDVVILDERLWNNNSKTSITQLSEILNENILLFNHQMLDEVNRIEDPDVWAKEILTKLDITITEKLLSQISRIHKIRNRKSFFQTITRDILHLNFVQKRVDDCKKENNYKYWLYKKKNIEIVNILFDKTNQKRFLLYNLNFENIGEYTSENNLNLNLGLNEYPHKIISIHQGIIDKIQTMLDNLVKDGNTQMKSNAIDLINMAIPSGFIKIIHSGRGKPSVEIPKGFHFVPYASLESAFYDCKFSLTDLLFNAKAELV